MATSRRRSLEFDAYAAGVPELAWIVEDALLQDALWPGLEAEVVCAGAVREPWNRSERARCWRWTMASDFAARLVVGADGAQSFVRAQAGIAAQESDYGQNAVVANFRCAKPHRNVACQWFQRGAVLALLPLPGEHVSMVWSLPTNEAARVRASTVKRCAAKSSRASNDELGELALVTPPRSYPLRRLAARRLVAPRVALAGDAGHVIHPLAGQGLNLGLQDARALAEVLAEREPQRDPGDLRLLRRYERSRAEPILAMDTMVDSLFRLFGAESPLAARLRNAGLNLTDRLPVLKNMLMRQAMADDVNRLRPAASRARVALGQRSADPQGARAQARRREDRGRAAGAGAGLWEVRFRSERAACASLYTDATGTYIIDGNIHELRTNRDLTEERLRKLNAIKFESLPLDQAVKIQRGNGKRVLAMFSDPYCPACRQFEQHAAAGRRRHRLRLHVPGDPAARTPTTRARCGARPTAPRPGSSSRRRRKPKLPEAAPAAPNPVDKLLELGRKLGVNSTPTLFLANGERVSGGLCRRRSQGAAGPGRQRLAGRPQQPHPALLAHAPGLRAGVGPGSPEEIRAHHAADRAAGVVRRHQALERAPPRADRWSPGTPARRAARSAGRPRGCARRAAAR